MKKNLGVVQAVYPMPVLMVAAYDETGKVNVMNAAWGMICAMDKIALFIDEDHKTTQNLLKTKAFTVALADQAHMDVADFFGIASGNKMDDKFERTGYHAVKSEHVNAPIVEEFPVVMECELAEVINTENMYAIVGKIVNVAAEEAVLDEKGKVDPTKLNALIFDQFRHGYYVSGEQVGKAWNAGAALMKKYARINGDLAGWGLALAGFFYFLLAGFVICSQWHLNTACSFRRVLRQNTVSLMFSTTVPT